MMIEKDLEELSLKEFEALTGIRWLLSLEFLSEKLRFLLERKTETFHKKKKLTLEQIWLGHYFQKDLLFPRLPDVLIRWIDLNVGWGVFARRAFRKMEFVAEYTGVVRKAKKQDRKNAFCFEYPICSGTSSSYTIDAMEQGGVARFMNHSKEPNLNASLVTLNGLNHIVLHAKTNIAEGEQLCYDYGPNYWKSRSDEMLL